MFFGLNLLPNLRDFPFWPDQKRHAVRAEVLSAEESFLPPNPVSFHDLTVLIRQQREWQFVFTGEFVV